VLGFGSVGAETSVSVIRISAVCFCVVSLTKVGNGKGKDHPRTGHERLDVPKSGYE